jgi:glycosyltransferase involved in cell wall biosynthesis
VAHAADAVAGLLPLPHVTRYPALPFHGHLDHPPLLQRTEFGRVNVEGWLFHETGKIRRVAATVDLQAWQILEHEGAHPYVAALFPHFPHAAACRIHGWIDVPAQLPQPLSVRVYAELPDGSWHLCHVERNHLYGDEQYKAPYARFSLITFAHSARALRRACLRRGLAVPLDKWFLRGLREVWREYRACAPRQTWRPPAATSPAMPAGNLPGNVVLITHNLNFEGAPLFLLEYAGYLASQGVKLSVISAGEGPLRNRFEALGARVDIVDITPLLKAENVRVLRVALRALARLADLAGADLVVANTLSTYWGVQLARLAGKRSLWYIHESTTPDSFYFGYMAPATLPVVKQAFALATQVSFLTGATRRYYQPQLTQPNHSINPGWIDLARIDRFRAENPREQLRARLGLSPATRLVVNIGSVCNRKGQHIFARAVDLLWRRQPELAARGEFLMVGGRQSAYDGAIVDLLGYLNRANLRVIPETPEPYVYYGAADMFVCSSYEESFPRVVLEAMAFALPIVSSNVHGIPEMTRPDHEALLVPPGDSSALADGMARMLADENFAESLASSGRARVAANYDAARRLPHHAALAARVAATADEGTPA